MGRLGGRVNVSNNWRIMLNILFWWCSGTEHPVVKAIELLSLSLPMRFVPITGALGSCRMLVGTFTAYSPWKHRPNIIRTNTSKNPLLAQELLFLSSSKLLENLSFHPQLVVTWLSGQGSLSLIELFLNHIYFLNHGAKFWIISIIFL